MSARGVVFSYKMEKIGEAKGNESAASIYTEFRSFTLTKNEQKNMNDTKYAYANEDPHVSPCLFALGSHSLPLRHASIMFGHDSPVAHLQNYTKTSINVTLVSIKLVLENINNSKKKSFCDKIYAMENKIKFCTIKNRTK